MKRFVRISTLQRVQNALADNLNYVFGGVMFMATSYVYLSHTLLLSKLQTFRRAKNRAGKDVEVHPKVRELAQEVLDTIKLTPAHEANIQFFTLGLGDLFSRGSCLGKSTALIGLSPVFEIETVSEFCARKPMYRFELLDLYSPEMEKYCEASVLSEKAKKFGIAREIMKINDYNVPVRGALSGLAALGAYSAGFYITNWRRSVTVGRKLRTYAVASLVFGGLYKFVINLYDNRRERTSDLWAAQLGKDYAEGGVEFYSKSLERNKAIREYFGGSYEKYFTIYGNERDNRWLVPTVQLTERRDNLMKYLAKYSEKEEKEAEEKEKQRESTQ